MSAHKLPAEGAVRAGENIEPRLIPFCKSARDLERFMQSMVGGPHTIYHFLGPLESEVGVQFHHRRLRRNGLGGINLNLVILLGAQGGQKQEGKSESQHERTIFAL